jgi:hypothetical protein
MSPYSKHSRDLLPFLNKCGNNKNRFLCGKRGFCGPRRDRAPWPSQFASTFKGLEGQLPTATLARRAPWCRCRPNASVRDYPRP